MSVNESDDFLKVHREAMEIINSVDEKPIPIEPPNKPSTPVIDKSAHHEIGQSKSVKGYTTTKLTETREIAPEDSLKGIFRDLSSTLRKIDINKTTTNQPGSVYEFQLIGIPGNFHVYAFDQHIQVNRRYSGQAYGKHKSDILETFVIKNSGEASYHLTEKVLVERPRLFSGSYVQTESHTIVDLRGSTKKGQKSNEPVVLAGLSRIRDEFSSSILDPKHDPDYMHQQLQKFRKPLEQELHKYGIVPRYNAYLEEDIFTSEQVPDPQNSLKPDQIQQAMQRGRNLIEFGHQYKFVNLFGIPGQWQVWFDIDASKKVKSTGLNFAPDPEKTKRHGEGIHLVHTLPEDEYNDRVSEFTLWQNGDAKFASKLIDRQTGKVNNITDPYYSSIWGVLDDPRQETPPNKPNLRNPHLVYAQFMGLQNSIDFSYQDYSQSWE